MQAYILRRIYLGALTVLLVSVVIFALMRVAPGDVALMLAMQGQEGISPDAIPQELLTRIREEMGLDRPLPMQYLVWMKGMVTLDWGKSYYSGVPIWEEFKARAPVTLELALTAVILATVVGIPAGIIMALKQDTWMDYLIRVFSLMGMSVPNFWMGTLVIMVGMLYFNWSPRLVWVSPFEDLPGNFAMYVWPAITTGWVAQATKARMLRSTMLEVLRQDYIRTAHAKGLRNFVVVYRHAMKNALIPVITIIGINISVIFGGSVIMETIFQLPGMGRYLITGMNQRDYDVVQVMVSVISVWIVFVNLVVDLTYGWLDPRVRYD